MPTPVLNWKSPYEVLHRKLPNYNNLRTFVCLCFVAKIGPHKDKFDVRTVKYMFLSYAVSHKAYNVMDLATCKMYSSMRICFPIMNLIVH